MCGYHNDSATTPVTQEDLLNQLTIALEKYQNQKLIKIFNSGSFFDPNEIHPTIQKKILTTLKKHAECISVESRPEYIAPATLKKTKQYLGSTTLEVGIGLETANDTIRQQAINKGFTFKAYQKATRLLKDYHAKIKTYVLIKPPFLTEKQAITDALSTVQQISSLTHTISFNPVNIQRGTLVEYLWKRHQYRPPWLWTIIEILKKSYAINPNVYIKCDISGGGKKRGAHNCPACNTPALTAIKQFSLTQKPQTLTDLTCECKQTWYDQLDLELLSFGSLPDFNEAYQ